MEERLAQTEEEIPELQAEIDFLKIQYLSSDQIIHEAKDLYSRWPELTPEEKRKIVENITEEIIVGKQDVTINLCYHPSSSEMMTSRQRKLTGVLVPDVDVRCSTCADQRGSAETIVVSYLDYLFLHAVCRCKFA